MHTFDINCIAQLYRNSYTLSSDNYLNILGYNMPTLLMLLEISSPKWSNLNHSSHPNSEKHSNLNFFDNLPKTDFCKTFYTLYHKREIYTALHFLTSKKKFLMLFPQFKNIFFPTVQKKEKLGPLNFL